jgi:hypothetical protein
MAVMTFMMRVQTSRQNEPSRRGNDGLSPRWRLVFAGSCDEDGFAGTFVPRMPRPRNLSIGAALKIPNG